MYVNFVIDYGTKIKDVLDKFSMKIGVPKFNYSFLLNGEELKYDDERKIEDYFKNDVTIGTITAMRFN